MSDYGNGGWMSGIKDCCRRDFDENKETAGSNWYTAWRLGWEMTSIRDVVVIDPVLVQFFKDAAEDRGSRLGTLAIAADYVRTHLDEGIVTPASRTAWEERRERCTDLYQDVKSKDDLVYGINLIIRHKIFPGINEHSFKSLSKDDMAGFDEKKMRAKAIRQVSKNPPKTMSAFESRVEEVYNSEKEKYVQGLAKESTISIPLFDMSFMLPYSYTRQYILGVSWETFILHLAGQARDLRAFFQFGPV